MKELFNLVLEQFLAASLKPSLATRVSLLAANDLQQEARGLKPMKENKHQRKYIF